MTETLMLTHLQFPSEQSALSKGGRVLVRMHCLARLQLLTSDERRSMSDYILTQGLYHRDFDIAPDLLEGDLAPHVMHLEAAMSDTGLPVFDCAQALHWLMTERLQGIDRRLLNPYRGAREIIDGLYFALRLNQYESGPYLGSSLGIAQLVGLVYSYEDLVEEGARMASGSRLSEFESSIRENASSLLRDITITQCQSALAMRNRAER